MTTLFRIPSYRVPIPYINFLYSSNRAIIGHLYIFTDINNNSDYFTDLDIDINYNSNVYKSGSLRIIGLKRKIGVGLNVDEQSVRIWAAPTDTLFDGAFLSGAQEGLLDGVLLQRYRIVWEVKTGNLATDVTDNAPLAIWQLYSGYFTEITKGGKTHIETKIKSPLMKLEVNTPRNYWQPGCLWTLFSTGCTLLKTSFTVTGIVSGNPSLIVIPVSGGIATPTGADGIPNYAQGRIQFTSGVNDGLLTLIDTNDTENLYLAYNLNNTPAIGDTFDYWPGCSKSFNTCDVKFDNSGNFRGFDKVPPVMLSM